MELLNNIWNALTTPNQNLTSLLTIPLFFIENILILYLILAIFKIEVKTKLNIIYVIISSLVSIISNFLIPSPVNMIFNYIALFILIYIIFSMSTTKTLIAVIAPTIIFALLSTLVSHPYMNILNITSTDILTIPIYRIFHLFIVYISIFIMILIFKHRKLHLEALDNLPKNTSRIIILNIFLGFFTIIVQLIVNAYCIDSLPLPVTFLVFITLLSYFSISIYSLTRVIKLSITTQKLQNVEEYNKTLSILHDNVRGFKHDFDNIVTTIGGYVKTNDMEGLKKYYVQLEDDCQKVNNLYVLNPKLINNPGVYSLLTTKYNEAEEKGIKINMSLLLDLSKLNMKIYDFTRVLGILLDNAIDASSECEEKIINIIFRDDTKNHRQLIIIENTYNDKNVDTEKIFNKGFSGKENHTGLGLWEVRKILNKSKNLDLYTTKNEKYFSQQIEIYY